MQCPERALSFLGDIEGSPLLLCHLKPPLSGFHPHSDPPLSLFASPVSAHLSVEVCLAHPSHHISLPGCSLSTSPELRVLAVASVTHRCRKPSFNQESPVCSFSASLCPGGGVSGAGLSVGRWAGEGPEGAGFQAQSHVSRGGGSLREWGCLQREPLSFRWPGISRGSSTWKPTWTNLCPPTAGGPRGSCPQPWPCWGSPTFSYWRVADVSGTCPCLQIRRFDLPEFLRGGRSKLATLAFYRTKTDSLTPFYLSN